MLRDMQELSYQEIADQLSLPEGTVKSRINRGRPNWPASSVVCEAAGARRCGANRAEESG